MRSEAAFAIIKCFSEGFCSTFSNRKNKQSTLLSLQLADLPSTVMVLVGVVVHLSARQWVNWGRRQGNVGPVGAVGFAGLGSGLGLLLLSSLPTCAGGEGREERMRLRDAAAGNQIVKQKSIINEWARGTALQITAAVSAT